SRITLVHPIRMTRGATGRLGFVLREVWTEHDTIDRGPVAGRGDHARVLAADLERRCELPRPVLREERGEGNDESRWRGTVRGNRGRVRDREGVLPQRIHRDAVETHRLVERRGARPEAVPHERIPEVLRATANAGASLQR